MSSFLADTLELHLFWTRFPTALCLSSDDINKSLQLIWRSGTRRFHLRVPDLQLSCGDLTRMAGHQESGPRNGHHATSHGWLNRTLVTPLLMHWNDLSLALNHQHAYIINMWHKPHWVNLFLTQGGSISLGHCQCPNKDMELQCKAHTYPTFLHPYVYHLITSTCS